MSTIYTCSGCGHRVSKTTTRCPNCSALLHGIRCTNCKFAGSAKDFVGDRCPKCGTAVKPREQPVSPAGCLIGCGVLAVLGGLVVGGCLAIGFFVVEPQRAAAGQSAEQFFALLKDGRQKEAYDSTSLGFRAAHDRPAFTALVKDIKIDDAASWAPKTNTNSHSDNEPGWTFDGYVTRKTGEVVPVKIKLIWEDNAWKVRSLSRGELN